ncbi:hypothetical protein OEA41_007853 [Lepraria neglecta]|uniref:Adenylyl cyclase-associated protein n=1 Tax=Lepraria neglecta TaxID=209136 RepID=A0AAD9ZGG1_9LECA|nr:hypothetical protein OEA41_007853 [Lepraria neglecta]
MNSLTTLIKRLEAATSRLEDMVPNVNDSAASTNGIESTTGQGMTAADGMGQARGNAPPPLRHMETLPPTIDDFDATINGEVKTFVNMSEEIGGLVAEQSAAVLRAFAAERKFLIVTTKAKKPEIQSPVYMEILKELQSMMGAVNDIREANRASPLFTHLTTVSEGIVMLGWITVDPKPADFVTECLSSAQFYGNRIIKEYKEKDRKHVEWVNAFYNIFKSLASYVKQHYPSGVTWNNQNGIDPQEALKQVQSGQISRSPPPSTGPAPPPPPPLPSFDGLPPPPPPVPPNGTGASSDSSDMGAVFDQISRGSDVTSHLRKVDPSSQTHKNPSLRTSSAVPPAPSRSTSQSSSRSIPSKKPKPESMRTKKPPKKELEGNKWLIENYDNPGQMIEIEAAINHSLLISRCTKTTIRVIGKANAISLDNCTQTSLVIDSLVSAVDVIKCPKFEMQVLGMLPTIMLDQVDGAAIYLNKETLHTTEVYTSKCTGVNINMPGQSEDEDYVEKPLPEQLKSVVRNGVLTSEIVEHAG